MSTKNINYFDYHDKDARIAGWGYKFILNLSYMHLHIVGLKADTFYRIFQGNVDITTQARIIHGRGTYNSDRTQIKSNSGGRIDVIVYTKRYDTTGSWSSRKWTQTITTPTTTGLYLVQASVIDSALLPVTNTGIVTSSSPAVDADNKPIPGATKAVVAKPEYPSYIFQNVEYDFIQTFYADTNAVNGAKKINLLNVKLYVKSKPNRTNNKSGLVAPGIQVHIIDVEQGVPVVSKSYKSSHVEMEYDQIAASTDASVPTTFTFEQPVTIETGKQYGIAIILEDDDYQLWYAREGDKTLGSTTPSSGSSKGHKGDLFKRTNTQANLKNPNKESVFNSLTDTDLRFDVNIAKYTANSVTIEMVNDDYEFMSFTNATGSFYSGEFVYQDNANATGTITITGGNTTLVGTGTTFTNTDIVTEDSYIVITDGSVNNTEIVQVKTIVDDTTIILTEPIPYTITGGAYKKTPVARVLVINPLYETAILKDSTASVNNYFGVGNTIIGVDSGATFVLNSLEYHEVNSFVPLFEYSTPSLTKTNISYRFTEVSGNVYTTNTTNTAVDLTFANYVDKYGGVIMSRSQEVTSNTNLYGADKSAVIFFNFQHNVANTSNVNLFESPTLKGDSIKISTSNWNINNDATNEHTNSGNAYSKHISTQLNFGDGRAAEDIRVISNIYKPSGTDVKIYAKILNNTDPEAFDDKNWTELQLIDGVGKYSALGNRNDIIEYTYGFPQYPPSNTALTGVANTTLNQTNVYGTNTSFDTALATNDVIKIYSSLFPNNYTIATVANVVNSSLITLSSPITNNNVVGEGFKIDTLATQHTAFNNKENDNIVRYFNNTGAKFDTYHTVALKTVLLSNTDFVAPAVDDTRIIGVSA